MRALHHPFSFVNLCQRIRNKLLTSWKQSGHPMPQNPILPPPLLDAAKRTSGIHATKLFRSPATCQRRVRAPSRRQGAATTRRTSASAGPSGFPHRIPEPLVVLEILCLNGALLVRRYDAGVQHAAYLAVVVGADAVPRRASRPGSSAQNAMRSRPDTPAPTDPSEATCSVRILPEARKVRIRLVSRRRPCCRKRTNIIIA
jgi:hypothetical protein